MNVFCVNEPKPEADGTMPHWNALRSHGPIIFIFTRKEWPAKHPDAALRVVDMRLAAFKPEEDALAFLGGDPFALLLIGAWAEARGFQYITWMRYEVVDGGVVAFVPTRVAVADLTLIGEDA